MQRRRTRSVAAFQTRKRERERRASVCPKERERERGKRVSFRRSCALCSIFAHSEENLAFSALCVTQSFLKKGALSRLFEEESRCARSARARSDTRTTRRFGPVDSRDLVPHPQGDAIICVSCSPRHYRYMLEHDPWRVPEDSLRKRPKPCTCFYESQTGTDFKNRKNSRWDAAKRPNFSKHDWSASRGARPSHGDLREIILGLVEIRERP